LKSLWCAGARVGLQRGSTMAYYNRREHHKKEVAVVAFTGSSLLVLSGLRWQGHVFAGLRVTAAGFRSRAA
jgi:hypothetical protein